MRHYKLFLAAILFLGAIGPALVPTLAQTPIPTPTALPASTEQHDFDISFAELGFENRTLYGPFAVTNYYIGLPAHWQPLPDSYVSLDLDYQAEQMVATGLPPESLVTHVTVSLDDQILGTTSFVTTTQTTMQVPLPAEILAAPEGERSRLAVSLHVSGDCLRIKQVFFTIQDTSRLHLAYTETPLTLDLALYPYPIYQRSFLPDQVRFVLPPQPTAAEMEGAVGMAARLGELSSAQLVISSTTPLELDTQAGSDEHLIIIGKPETNDLIPWLDENVDLPVSLHTRQMELVTRGPAGSGPGTEITLAAVATNTEDYMAPALQLQANLPATAEVTACQPECVTEGSSALWSLEALAPGEEAQVSVTLQVTRPITATVLEYTFTLLDAELGLLNASSFTTTVNPALPADVAPITHKAEEDYFFVQGEKAIHENDGIIQEIVSPWDPTRMILIVTGLNDEALHKASFAMSSGTYFPGMEGPVALVRDTHPTSASISELRGTDVTFADLGYDEEVVYGIRGQEIEYLFDLPLSWRLTSDAYVELLFAHSSLLDYDESSLTILLNGTPVGSVALDESNATQGTLKAPLPQSQIRYDRANRLTVLVDMRLEDECYDPRSSQIWSRLSNESLLHLAHTQQPLPQLDLDIYPQPFAVQPDLHDVAFALPAVPGPAECDGVLHLAAELGNAAGGETFSPVVLLGEPANWEEVAGYHVIAIGRPTTNSTVGRVNDDLPQPFIPGSDEIAQVIDDVVFRLPPGLSLGYVQEIPSPWNDDRAFLAVTGTTDEGVGWAIAALTVNEMAWQLEGNLALVREGELHSTDTRLPAPTAQATEAATALPETSSEATPTPAPPTATPTLSLTATPAASATAMPSPTATATHVPPTISPDLAEHESPSWLTPLIIIAVLAIVAILGVALWQARRR